MKVNRELLEEIIKIPQYVYAEQNPSNNSPLFHLYGRVHTNQNLPEFAGELLTPAHWTQSATCVCWYKDYNNHSTGPLYVLGKSYLSLHSTVNHLHSRKGRILTQQHIATIDSQFQFFPTLASNIGWNTEAWQELKKQIDTNTSLKSDLSWEPGAKRADIFCIDTAEMICNHSNPDLWVDANFRKLLRTGHKHALAAQTASRRSLQTLHNSANATFLETTKESDTYETLTLATELLSAGVPLTEIMNVARAVQP